MYQRDVIDERLFKGEEEGGGGRDFPLTTIPLDNLTCSVWRRRFGKVPVITAGLSYPFFN